MRPVHEIRAEARAALGRGDADRARALLLEALANGVAREDEYVLAAQEMRELLVAEGDARAALTVDWYAGQERTQGPLLAGVPEVDRARTYELWASRASGAEQAALHRRAADAFEAAGQLVRAAIACERAFDHVRALALWSRLADALGRQEADLYAAGLARFDVARMARAVGDRAREREATVQAVSLLEEAADRFESVGRRERAFDCFQVLVAIGKESGELEHVLEGYVNAIRILREDLLRYFALQSYDEAVTAAAKSGETTAAATLAREMADYARKERLVPVANQALLTQAELWYQTARAARGRNASPDAVENALSAAILAYGEAGQFARVRGLYEELAKGATSDGRRAQHERSARRYATAVDLPLDAAPLARHLRQEAGFPEVWHVDLVEWEQRGSATEATADVILDRGAWTEATRRRAVSARLVALGSEGAPPARAAEGESAANAQRLARELAHVELYAMLAPLERLFERPERDVKIAVLRALSRFLFKRTFDTVRRALAEPDADVVEAAARTIEELRFPHAFDPLSRILRESESARVRAAALRALARIDTQEVAELLLGVIEHHRPDERDVAVAALGETRVSRFFELARAELPRLSPEVQAPLRKLLAARGMAT